MTIETDEDLQQLKIIGRIVARILQEMMQRVEPGMTTLELDRLVRPCLKNTLFAPRHK